MTCRTKCVSTERDHQLFPQATGLGRNMNVPLSRLRARAAGGESIYYYVVTSIRRRNGEFIQKGCGPNFQGGLITLCTCKHRMRTSVDIDEWKGTWIAGFTTSSAGKGRNFLVYLMRVEHAFASHHDLWFSTAISSETKRAKAVHLDRFGDIFRPRNKTTDPRATNSYLPPCKDHCHAERWEKDVSYEGYGGRRAALLVGDLTRSFLWNRPLLYCVDKLGRGQRKCTLDSFLAQLRTGEAQ